MTMHWMKPLTACKKRRSFTNKHGKLGRSGTRYADLSGLVYHQRLLQPTGDIPPLNIKRAQAQYENGAKTKSSRFFRPFRVKRNG